MPAATGTVAWSGGSARPRTPVPAGDPAMAGRMREQGLDPLPGGEAEFAELLRREREVWVPLIRALGIALD